MVFYGRDSFRYRSPIRSGLAENDTVPGRFFLARRSGPKPRPAVILLHGWNGEQGYRLLFPILARRFAAFGLSVVMIELPYHGARKPGRGIFRNFLSGDIAHMLAATEQAVADIRALAGWLEAEGFGPLGFWGISLGAWIGGLAAVAEERLSAGVLVAPVPRIDQAIENLEFCRHIRASLAGNGLSSTRFNLKAYSSPVAPRNLLIVKPVYDLFARSESVEELWRAWGETDIWRVRHGHISVLFSVPVMLGTGRWLSRRLRRG